MPARDAPARPVPARFVEPRWAFLKEAEAYSGVPVRTLRDWIARGWLPATRLGPKRIQVDLNDLDALRRELPSAASAS
jgi:excisionase family DNA binding protein